MTELTLPFGEETGADGEDPGGANGIPLTVDELARRIGERPPTPEQRAAIEAPLEPLALVAGAGSGKTQTMALRVLWLVGNGVVAPHRVLGLTFTRKAAGELGVRVRTLLRRMVDAHETRAFLPADVAAALRSGEPTVSTYHSYAAALLDEHALRLGVEPGLQLVGEARAWQLAWEVVDRYDGPLDAVDRAQSTVVRYVLALAGDLAEHLHEPDVLLDHERRVREAVERAQALQPRKDGAEFGRTQEARGQLIPLVQEYLALKERRGVLDHGDQVRLAALLARDSADVRAGERARWGAVLLDEYQDTGEAQRVLLTALFGGGHGVTAVGDPRQSIYGWRGASAGNLERFGTDFGGTRRGGLTTSFRNGAAVLAVANAVADRLPVAGGPSSAPLRAAPGRDGPGEVRCALLETVEDEAALVADQLVSAARAGTAWGGMAVLSRRRSAFPRLEQALLARGVPVEVVGLGGLLLRPEVVDVVATLQVLADPTAGAALLRLLTGPRWRLGPRDLARLGERAGRLARRRPDEAARDDAEGTGAADPVAPRDAEPVAEYDVVDEKSLVDALDKPGPPEAYSAEGYRRILALRKELQDLRGWTGQPLPELVAHVARVVGLDVELAAARPAGEALLDLDRLVEEAEDFVEQGDDPGLVAFLAYLEAARDQEDGLEVEQPGASGERVRVMTVHAAKGLEWDVVAVVGMATKVFPAEGQAVPNWARQCAALPFDLRGDRDALPALRWAGAADGKELVVELARFAEACKERSLVEERRLAYVAVTRPRDLLLCTAARWDDAAKPRGPSELLTLVHDVVRAGGGAPLAWADEPAEGAVNPRNAGEHRLPWPTDPLGGRRAAVERGAALVREQMARGPGSDGPPGPWAEEVDLLLAEHARLRRRSTSATVDVVLPPTLSVSQLVELRRSPAELARSLRRPVPHQPRPQARRGTRFHLWLEERWGQQRLLDIDELPGAADETAPTDEDLAALQEAFRRSAWWSRTPHELEVPFDLRLGDVVLRGRIDAVFTDAPDGYVDVVDWKTGRPPAAGDRREASARAVQLAAYRLAWHLLNPEVPVERIRAAFHYVPDDVTVHPVDLLDEDALRALVAEIPDVEDPQV